jgi:hypothetical protein
MLALVRYATYYNHNRIQYNTISLFSVNPCARGIPFRSQGVNVQCSAINPTVCPAGYYCHIGDTAITSVCCQALGMCLLMRYQNPEWMYKMDTIVQILYHYSMYLLIIDKRCKMCLIGFNMKKGSNASACYSVLVRLCQLHDTIITLLVSFQIEYLATNTRVMFKNVYLIKKTYMENDCRQRQVYCNVTV